VMEAISSMAITFVTTWVKTGVKNL